MTRKPALLPEIDGETILFGIIGYPVSHSLSPKIHNSAFHSIGLNAAYLPLSVPKPDKSLKNWILSIQNFRGFSVTIPHKSWAYKIADERDDLSRCCGASNTLIKLPNNRLAAYNTDGPGALDALRKSGVKLKNKQILLLGYGGSASAIAHSLLLEENPQNLYVHGRNPKKRNNFTNTLRRSHPNMRLKIHSNEMDQINPDEIDIIIHTTPLGMKNQEQAIPLPEGFIQKKHTVFDIVYTPHNTPLLEYAAKKGAKTVHGYLMLLYQAVRQFELFTGKKAPIKLMEKKLCEALKIK